MLHQHVPFPPWHGLHRGDDGGNGDASETSRSGRLSTHRGVLILDMQEKEFEVFETGIYKHGQCSIHEVTAAGRNTVLHVAAAQGHHELIRELYLRFRDHQGLLSRRNLALDTPLHSAARAGHAAAVKMLAEGAHSVVKDLLCKGKVRTNVLNKDGHTALDLAAGSTNFFTMVSLVVTLVAYGAQLRPQRQDHLKPWMSAAACQGQGKGIDKTSDSLAVVQRDHGPGHPRSQGHLQVVPLPGHRGRGVVRGRGGPARLRQGIALRGLVEELRAGAALHVGVAREPFPGLQRGADSRGERKGGLLLRLLGHLRGRLFPHHLHRQVDRASHWVTHSLEVSTSVQAIQSTACHQAAVSARRRYRSQLDSLFGYKFISLRRRCYHSCNVLQRGASATAHLTCTCTCTFSTFPLEKSSMHVYIASCIHCYWRLGLLPSSVSNFAEC
ncbi:uncharacterized protein LOC8082080 isoform X2 [Sorghum bicolor]|uniref:Uncharacterized protein n=1 Tax=Sorghum bicolor TaxID=4558 RepID=C5Y7H6_SORBI|nr:uncharacterized protein LOC8082080 isoform X2 [Sorghum bicolor]EES08937.2 hypothetical protein SORBI_3005G208500 [Sorghum bicolor]|eukprot:XP_021316490.1 uncharacterized protein LOC8082080 isoform X2 [Sorghum bicolor]